MTQPDTILAVNAHHMAQGFHLPHDYAHWNASAALVGQGTDVTVEGERNRAIAIKNGGWGSGSLLDMPYRLASCPENPASLCVTRS